MLYHKNDAIVANFEKYRPLHFASELGEVEVVKKLLERGCKVDVKTNRNETPLHFAIEGTLFYDEGFEVFLILLKHGADVNVKDNFGRGDTPLFKALKERYLKDHRRNVQLQVIQRLLIEDDIDLNIRDRDGKTALQIAMDKKDMDSARMIAKKMCPKSKITDSIYPLKCFM